MPDEGREALGPNRALTNIGVSVTVAPEFNLRVVEMKTPKPLETDGRLNIPNELFGAFDTRVVNTTRPKVLGVDAQS